MATDFGDDIGESAKRFASMLLREWMMMHRASIRSGNYHTAQDANGQTVAQIPCDSPEQQAKIVEALREEGIDAKPAMVPGVEIPESQRDKMLELMDKMEKDSASVYENLAAKEPDALQLGRLGELNRRGIVSDQELAQLAGKDFTALKANEILASHNKEVYFDQSGKIPATDVQLEKLAELREIGSIGNIDMMKLGKFPSFEKAQELIEATPITEAEILKDAATKGKISASELEQGLKILDSGEFDNNTLGRIIKEKVADAGYDMNDLSKNDARMRPSHDGMDPDAHTQQIEGNWLDEVREKLDEVIRPGMTDEELAWAADKAGLNVEYANGRKDFQFQVRDTNLTHGGNWVNGATLGEKYSRSAFKLTKDPLTRTLAQAKEMVAETRSAEKSNALGRDEQIVPHDPQAR